MKQKVKEIGEKYSRKLETHKNVEGVILGDTANIETFDPYFIIELHVFYDKEIPGPEERKLFLDNPPAFESLPSHPVDRFLEKDLPLVIYYRDVAGINTILHRIYSNQWIYRPDTSSTLYQIRHGLVLYSRSSWLKEVQEKTAIPGTPFWKCMIDFSHILVENSLMDLGAALFKNDMILYYTALAAFIRYTCGFLFSLNRQFDPPVRLLGEKLEKLPVLPDEFISRFQILCSKDADYSIEKKVEIARLIAKSILPLQLDE